MFRQEPEEDLAKVIAPDMDVTRGLTGLTFLATIFVVFLAGFWPWPREDEGRDTDSTFRDPLRCLKSLLHCIHGSCLTSLKSGDTHPTD